MEVFYLVMESEASTIHSNKQPSMMIITIRC